MNAIFVNMEAWHNVLKKGTTFFMNLDHYLMRKIVGAHSKAPIQLLHMHNIIHKPKNLLIRRVFEAQQKNPCKGDGCELVKEDMDLLNIDIDEEAMYGMSKAQFQSIVRKHVIPATFTSLKTRRGRPR